VAAARASWGRYAEFLRERDALANRDWLSMRDQVGGWGFGGGPDWVWCGGGRHVRLAA